MKNKHLKVIPALLLSLSLLSCSEDTYGYNCYQCYYSTQITSSLSLPYSSITQKKVINQLDDKSLTSSYYVNYYITNTQTELNTFYSQNNLTIDPKEKIKYETLDENTMRLFVIAQIPKGYKTVRRNDEQQSKKDGGVELITSNLYFYETKPETSYCYLDVTKDESITEDYVYSFFYIINSSYSTIIKENQIRFLIANYSISTTAL
jgi:hypothetical protein